MTSQSVGGDRAGLSVRVQSGEPRKRGSATAGRAGASVRKYPRDRRTAVTALAGILMPPASPMRRLTAAGSQSTVDRHDRPGHEPGVVTGEESDDVGDLRRLGGPAHRYPAKELGDVVFGDVGGGVGGGE